MKQKLYGRKIKNDACSMPKYDDGQRTAKLLRIFKDLAI